MILRFSLEDEVIVRSLLKQLPKKQRKAIILRFWEGYLIEEVATKLKISWREADKLITTGLLKIKKECMAHPRSSKKTTLAA